MHALSNLDKFLDGKNEIAILGYVLLPSRVYEDSLSEDIKLSNDEYIQLMSALASVRQALYGDLESTTAFKNALGPELHSKLCKLNTLATGDDLEDKNAAVDAFTPRVFQEELEHVELTIQEINKGGIRTAAERVA